MPGIILDTRNAAVPKTNDFPGAYIIVGMILYLNSFAFLFLRCSIWFQFFKSDHWAGSGL